MKQLFEKYIRDDILDELLKHKSKYDVDENKYIQFCKNRINVYMKQIKLKNISINNKYISRGIFKNKKNKFLTKHIDKKFDRNKMYIKELQYFLNCVDNEAVQ